MNQIKGKQSQDGFLPSIPVQQSSNRIQLVSPHNPTHVLTQSYSQAQMRKKKNEIVNANFSTTHIAKAGTLVNLQEQTKRIQNGNQLERQLESKISINSSLINQITPSRTSSQQSIVHIIPFNDHSSTKNQLSPLSKPLFNSSRAGSFLNSSQLPLDKPISRQGGSSLNSQEKSLQTIQQIPRITSPSLVEFPDSALTKRVDKSESFKSNDHESYFPQTTLIKQHEEIFPSNGKNFQKISKDRNEITQIMIDSDQNRLNFMLEKGQNFEKNEQLMKYKIQNTQLKENLRKQETLVYQLRAEIEILKQQLKERNSKLTTPQTSNYPLERPQVMKSDALVNVDQIEQLQTQINALNESHASELNELLKQNKSLSEELQRILLKNQELQVSQAIQNKAPKQDLPVINNDNQCNQCVLHHQNIKSLESELSSIKIENENLTQEVSNLENKFNEFKSEHEMIKERYEQYIKEQTNDMLNADKEKREWRKKFDDLQLQVNKIKNGSDISKIISKNEYSLVRTDLFEAIEKEKKNYELQFNIYQQERDRLNEQLQQERAQTKKLTEQVVSLESHLEWLKKRGAQTSKQNGTFNYMGLTNEILQLKKVIDLHIKQIPEGAGDRSENNSSINQPQNIVNKVDEMAELNAKMIKTINKIQDEETKQQQFVDQIPVLKSFENATIKVEKNLNCAKCEELISETITCVPCGHNFCQKCHYQNESHIEQDEKMIACQICGPVTMIYRNEVLDEIIEMFNTMKSTKEFLKAFLRKKD